MSKIISTIIISAFCIFSFFGCGGNESTGYEFAKWEFSGYVKDGASDKTLENVLISYFNTDDVNHRILGS